MFLSTQKVVNTRVVSHTCAQLSVARWRIRGKFGKYHFLNVYWTWYFVWIHNSWVVDEKQFSGSTIKFYTLHSDYPNISNWSSMSYTLPTIINPGGSQGTIQSIQLFQQGFLVECMVQHLPMLDDLGEDWVGILSYRVMHVCMVQHLPMLDDLREDWAGIDANFLYW